MEEDIIKWNEVYDTSELSDDIIPELGITQKEFFEGELNRIEDSPVTQAIFRAYKRYNDSDDRICLRDSHGIARPGVNEIAINYNAIIAFHNDSNYIQSTGSMIVHETGHIIGEHLNLFQGSVPEAPEFTNKTQLEEGYNRILETRDNFIYHIIRGEELNGSFTYEGNNYELSVVNSGEENKLLVSKNGEKFEFPFIADPYSITIAIRNVEGMMLEDFTKIPNGEDYFVYKEKMLIDEHKIRNLPEENFGMDIQNYFDFLEHFEQGLLRLGHYESADVGEDYTLVNTYDKVIAGQSPEHLQTFFKLKDRAWGEFFSDSTDLLIRQNLLEFEKIAADSQLKGEELDKLLEIQKTLKLKGVELKIDSDEVKGYSIEIDNIYYRGNLADKTKERN